MQQGDRPLDLCQLLLPATTRRKTNDFCRRPQPAALLTELFGSCTDRDQALVCEPTPASSEDFTKLVELKALRREWNTRLKNGGAMFFSSHTPLVSVCRTNAPDDELTKFVGSRVFFLEQTAYVTIQPASDGTPSTEKERNYRPRPQLEQNAYVISSAVLDRQGKGTFEEQERMHALRVME